MAIDQAPNARTRDAQVLQRTREVLALQRDASRPGRPLSVLLAGGGLALAALLLAAAMAYRTWVSGEIDEEPAVFGLSFLFGFYVLGVFLFSLGYELFDTGRALRLTLIISVLSFLAVVLIGAVGVSLLKLRQGSGAVKGLAGGRDVNDGAGLLEGVLGLVGAGERSERDDNPGWFGVPLPPPPPQEPVDFLITCPNCKRRFTPAPPSAICPWCDQAALSA